MAAFFHGGTEAQEASSPSSEFALQQPQHSLLPMNSFDHALVHAPSSLPVVPTTVDMFTSTPHHHHPYSSCFGSLVDPDPTRDVMNPGLSRSHGFELLPRPLLPVVSPVNGKKLSLSLYDQQTQMQTDHVEQGNSPVSTVTNGALFRTNGNGFDIRYLKAVQELLDEIVNVENTKKIDSDVSKGNLRTKTEFSSDGFSGSDGIGVGRKAIVGDLTPVYRQELQIKKAKLVSMVEELEQRYRNYHDQMQAIVSPFEQAAGLGAAKSYTSLALQTISKQFRSLKTAIRSQIKLMRMGLGEEYISSNVGEGCRLRRIADQTQLRHLGVMQQHHNHADAWRPQRGLPERAVSILRAWLFEHFLHPYPKDLDKQLLAKQTGLTRSQVSNWFINARVRLWKPMVEEMYLEEMKVERRRNDDNVNENNDLELGVSSWKQPSHNASDLLIPENLSLYINNKNNNVSDQCSSAIASTNCLTVVSHHGGIVSPQKKRRTTQNDFTMPNSSSTIVSFDVERKQQISHAVRDANNTIHFNGGLENHQQAMYGNAVSLSLGLPHSCDKTFTKIPFGTSNQIGFSTVFSSPTYQNTDNLDKQRFVANVTTLLPDFIA